MTDEVTTRWDGTATEHEHACCSGRGCPDRKSQMSRGALRKVGFPVCPLGKTHNTLRRRIEVVMSAHCQHCDAGIGDDAEFCRAVGRNSRQWSRLSHVLRAMDSLSTRRLVLAAIWMPRFGLTADKLRRIDPGHQLWSDVKNAAMCIGSWILNALEKLGLELGTTDRHRCNGRMHTRSSSQVSRNTTTPFVRASTRS